MWYAVFDKASGRLVSLGTVLADPLPKNLAAQELPGPPKDDQMWDEATRSFVPRPAPVVRDLVAEFLAAPELAQLNVAAKDKVRLVAERVLADWRWQ